MAKFVIMLRVKDGMFFAEEWLACFEKIADEIVVLDNGSTDGTYEKLKSHPKVVDIIQTEGYNEGRDKNLLYQRVRLRRPDWCLWIDIDEIFEPELTRADFDKLMSSKFFNKFAFRRFHFMDREHFAGSLYRLNYSAGHDRLMWRENPTGYFQNLIIDSPNVKGIKGLKYNTDFRLKHLGYINKDLVDKKADIYRQIIPEKEDIFQSMYLQGERPIKWIDERKHVKTVMLNQVLNVLQMTHIIPKVIRKIKSAF
ncbi:MAG: glycosyltransferase [Pedobacter sp.]|nr:MAG: glycosyltransferase [Pedobacter sp.]